MTWWILPLWFKPNLWNSFSPFWVMMLRVKELIQVYNYDQLVFEPSLSTHWQTRCSDNEILNYLKTETTHLRSLTIKRLTKWSTYLIIRPNKLGNKLILSFLCKPFSIDRFHPLKDIGFQSFNLATSPILLNSNDCNMNGSRKHET